MSYKAFSKSMFIFIIILVVIITTLMTFKAFGKTNQAIKSCSRDGSPIKGEVCSDLNGCDLFYFNTAENDFYSDWYICGADLTTDSGGFWFSSEVSNYYCRWSDAYCWLNQGVHAWVWRENDNYGKLRGVTWWAYPNRKDLYTPLTIGNEDNSFNNSCPKSSVFNTLTGIKNISNCKTSQSEAYPAPAYPSP